MKTKQTLFGQSQGWEGYDLLKIFVQADGQSVEACIACKCKDQHQVIPQKVSVSFVCTIEGIYEHFKTIKSFVAFFYTRYDADCILGRNVQVWKSFKEAWVVDTVAAANKTFKQMTIHVSARMSMQKDIKNATHIKKQKGVGPLWRLQGRPNVQAWRHRKYLEVHT